jgi:hypothetical protein
MKKLLLLAIVMMVSASSFAQREVGSLSLQPRIGLIGADFNNTEDTEGRVGLLAGAEMEYYVSSNVGLSWGLFYAQQGAKLKNRDVTWKLDYLNVPLIANFYIWKGLALKAGLQPGINISSKLDGSKGSYHESVNIDDVVKTFDLAIPVGISYDFGRLVLDARYTIGCTKIFKDDYLDSKNITFQIGIGYKFSL